MKVRISVIRCAMLLLVLMHVGLLQAQVDSFATFYKKGKHHVFEPYSHKTFNAIFETNFYCFAQSELGVMMVGAEQSGFQTFNGTSWRSYQKYMNATGARCITIKKGRTYFAGKDFLRSAITEDLELFHQFTHLEFKDLLDPKDVNEGLIGEIRNVVVLNHKILFESESGIWLLRDQKLKLLCGNGQLFDVGDDVFIWQNGVGLLKYVTARNTLDTIIGNTDITDVVGIVSLKGTLVVISRRLGVYICGLNGLKRINGQLSNWLQGKEATAVVKIAENNIGIGTAQGGICASNLEGRILTLINRSDGLKKLKVNDLFVDNIQQLWVAMDGALQVVDYPDPVSQCDETFGYEGMANALVEWRDSLYVASSKGLFSRELQYHNEFDPRFYKEKLVKEACWSLCVSNGSLLVATSSGLLVKQNEEWTTLLSGAFKAIASSTRDENEVYAAGERGVWSLTYTGSEWTVQKQLTSESVPVKNMIHYGNRLWMGTELGACTLPLWGDAMPRYLKAKGYGGRSHSGAMNVHRARNGVFFQNGGYWEVDTLKWTVTHPAVLYKEFWGYTHFSNSGRFYRSFWPSNKRVSKSAVRSQSPWGTLVDENRDILAHAGRGRDWSMSLRKFGGFDITYLASDGILYFSTGEDELHMYDGRLNAFDQIHFSAFVIGLESQGKDVKMTNSNNTLDTVYFADLYDGLPDTWNDLRIVYAATGVDASEDLRFSYKLYQKGSTPPAFEEITSNAFANFKSLASGKYVFEVKAFITRYNLSVYSKPGIFEFEIRPPWYRRVWAFLCYGILLIALFVMGVKLYNRRLELQKVRLKKIVNDRTQEILERNEEIQAQNDALKEKSLRIEAMMMDTVHRTKGHIQLTKNLLEMQARRMHDLEGKAALKDANGRLDLLEKVQRLILQTPESDYIHTASFLTSVATTLQEAYGFDNDLFQLDLDVEDVGINAGDATYLGLLASEVMTNAFKHAFSEQQRPVLRVLFKAREGGWILRIADNGPGTVQDVQKGSYGQKLIRLFAQQLGAVLKVYTSNGAVYEVMKHG